MRLVDFDDALREVLQPVAQNVFELEARPLLCGDQLRLLQVDRDAAARFLVSRFEQVVPIADGIFLHLPLPFMKEDGHRAYGQQVPVGDSGRSALATIWKFLNQCFQGFAIRAGDLFDESAVRVLDAPGARQ